MEQEYRKPISQELLDKLGKFTGGLKNKTKGSNMLNDLEVQSEQISDLVKALACATKEFGTVDKNKTNPFFKSKYAELSEIRKHVSPILAKHGLVIQHFHMDKCLVTQLSHESGQFQRSFFRLYNTKGDAQGEGSATTYASRYSIQSMLGIVTEEDDDGNSISKPRSYDGPLGRALNVMPFGKHKGKKFDDIDPDDLRSAADWMTSQDSKKFKDLIAKIDNYLKENV